MELRLPTTRALEHQRSDVLRRRGSAARQRTDFVRSPRTAQRDPPLVGRGDPRDRAVRRRSSGARQGTARGRGGSRSVARTRPAAHHGRRHRHREAAVPRPVLVGVRRHRYRRRSDRRSPRCGHHRGPTHAPSHPPRPQRRERSQRRHRHSLRQLLPHRRRQRHRAAELLARRRDRRPRPRSRVRHRHRCRRRHGCSPIPVQRAAPRRETSAPSHWDCSPTRRRSSSARTASSPPSWPASPTASWIAAPRPPRPEDDARPHPPERRTAVVRRVVLLRGRDGARPRRRRLAGRRVRAAGAHRAPHGARGVVAARRRTRWGDRRGGRLVRAPRSRLGRVRTTGPRPVGARPTATACSSPSPPSSR